jgi:hypothetical protein
MAKKKSRTELRMRLPEQYLKLRSDFKKTSRNFFYMIYRSLDKDYVFETERCSEVRVTPFTS